MTSTLTIGQAAKTAETRPATIRYYEKIGLLPLPARSSGNYWGYGPDDVARLGFVRRTRELGFPLEQIRELMELAGRHDHDCCTVDDLTKLHVGSIEKKIQDLSALRNELVGLLDACRGGRVADCRIIEALAPHRDD